jgi:hypothetical protein
MIPQQVPSRGESNCGFITGLLGSSKGVTIGTGLESEAGQTYITELSYDNSVIYVRVYDREGQRYQSSPHYFCGFLRSKC